MRAGYSELGLIEQPAIDPLTTLGWSFKNLYAESFGELGSEGRESEHQGNMTPTCVTRPHKISGMLTGTTLAR